MVSSGIQSLVFRSQSYFIELLMISPSYKLLYKFLPVSRLLGISYIILQEIFGFFFSLENNLLGRWCDVGQGFIFFHMPIVPTSFNFFIALHQYKLHESRVQIYMSIFQGSVLYSIPLVCLCVNTALLTYQNFIIMYVSQ